MRNLSEVKLYDQKTTSIRPKTTSEIFKPVAETDYEKKKEKEKKTIHSEIKRVSLEQSLI